MTPHVPHPGGLASASAPRVPAGKSLFSQHYLQHRLPEHAEWQDDAQAVFDAVRALWLKAKTFGANWNEAQTEDEFIKPVLEALGWKFTVQTKSQKKGSVTRPDYALFADQAAKEAAYPHQGHDDAFYVHATAIAEAKYWGRPLSQQDASGRNAWKVGSNPSHQMVSYLVGTRVAWGILTNGMIWRLYSREASSVASDFYEVDLGLIFDFLSSDGEPTGEQLAGFKRWWLFFRRQAFLPGSAGKTFVQGVLEGSATYARRVSDKLKELIFEEVMPEIAGGLVAFRRRQLGVQAESQESLRGVYSACLSLLYKLLFVLYAEARDLLPMANAGYREQSLTELARWAAQRIDQGLPISDATFATPRYDALLALFRRIDQGEATLGIPHYDGGLFNPAHPDNVFLERHKLSDRAVARVVDIMVRDAGEPVDYAYISVRNLGAIYEGLLEYRLNVLDAAAGKVELINDKGERKLSGSYYTPDYIVEYIVEGTLDPILDERAGRFTAAMDHCAEVRHALGRTADHATIARLREQLEQDERAAAEAFLGIRVCDPAAGSGHFLVNAVDHLTDGVIRRMQVYHDTHSDVPWDWNPIQRLITRMRKEIMDELARQGIAVDAARLDDTALLTRLVMKRCIYGVDLNPMAVELAKLSLWLHSFTVGAPLSFLDHHLRWGNSIVGADVRTVEQAMRVGEGGQFALFQGPFAGLLDLTAVMTEVAERADATLADVQQSAEAFARFQAELTPYKRMLDLWVSQYFPATAAAGKRGGAPVEFLTLHSDEVLPALRGESEVEPRYQEAIERARTLWEEKRFFHWDLEFPEVFIDLRRRDWAEDPGFDAVIGNPPYVRQEQMAAHKPYLLAAFRSIYHGMADFSIYFTGRGMQQLRLGGRLAYIISNSWLHANYATPLRAYLRTKVTVEQIIDLGDNRVFDDAPDVYAAVQVIRRNMPIERSCAQVAVFKRNEGVQPFAQKVAAKQAPVSIFDQSDEGWQLGGSAERNILSKLMNTGRSLSEVLSRRMYYGIKTGLNEAFVVGDAQRNAMVVQDPTCSHLLKRLLRGEDLRPWYQEDEGRWLIALPSGWTRSTLGTGLSEADGWAALQVRHPAISTHLAPFAEAARQRQDQGEYWWELRSCDYYGAFDQPKIMWPDIAKFPRFSWDTSGYYLGNTAYFVNFNEPWLLAVLASRSIWYFISQTSTPFGERAGTSRYRLFDQFMQAIPVPEPSAAEKAALSKIALALTQQANARYSLDRKTQHRIATDLGNDAALNQKLTAWWKLNFPAFRSEVKKAFHQDIPLKDRDEWESWLAERCAEHRRLTDEIVRLETALNEMVYVLFGLTPDEIRSIEESTKYHFGEV